MPRGRPPTRDTRDAIFAAAAEAFSRRGFDGVVVEDIARAAGVNKAMIYYHFTDKLALYREIVRDMLRDAGGVTTAIADAPDPPAIKVERFIAAFVALTDARPYFPTLMMREIAEGAPHLDVDTLSLIRAVFVAFGRIIGEGHAEGEFREVHPVLAYITVLGPLMFNAARERVAAQPGRGQLPMFADVPHGELTKHMQRVALRMLQKD
jgi:TetR/AcrR family transcriptional regulator